ncbi:hypothetical protein M8J77_016545 [Diaphorina citri]|nr:hypothetical protein M8J77_016545 [Diaphorina citri]
MGKREGAKEEKEEEVEEEEEDEEEKEKRRKRRRRRRKRSYTGSHSLTLMAYEGYVNIVNPVPTRMLASKELYVVSTPPSRSAPICCIDSPSH